MPAGPRPRRPGPGGRRAAGTWLGYSPGLDAPNRPRLRGFLQSMTGLVLLLPLVLTLAEGMAVQAAVLAARSRSGQARWGLLPVPGRELVAGLLGAAACGLLADGVAMAWSDPVRQALSLGGSVAAAVVAACAVALAVPALLSSLRLSPRLPAGPVARALAGVVAVALYWGLARLLLG